MDNIALIKQPVSKELDLFLEEFNNSFESDSSILQEVRKYLIHSGKQIRPLLVLLAAKACGNLDSASINASVLVELLHTASLIHDDVVDKTEKRRGKPSLNALVDNRAAVLIGDYILATALIRSTFSDDINIISLISKVGLNLSEGELVQMEAVQDTIIDESVYYNVIRKKTAILFSVCAEIGATCGGATEHIREKFRNFGREIGFAFQIKDDIFDYFDDPIIGKPTGNDIREGKVTLPLLHVLSNLDDSQKEKYCNILKRENLNSEEIAMFISLAIKGGGIEYAESRMEHHIQNAKREIENLPDSESKKSLLLLADYIVQRNR